jgi:hypothetical protein
MDFVATGSHIFQTSIYPLDTHKPASSHANAPRTRSTTRVACVLNQKLVGDVTTPADVRTRAVQRSPTSDYFLY